jgi:hypothetical protein
MAMQHPYFDDLDKTKLAKDYWTYMLLDWRGR